MAAKAAFFLCLFLGSTSTFAQGNMTASGAFTPGHTVRCQDSSCTTTIDAGGAGGSQRPGQGYLSELGLMGTGLNLCDYTALTNNSGGYYRLCIGANVNGGGALFSFDAIGSAPPLPWQIELNGQFYPFPPPGNGNVLGPKSSTINRLAAWGNPDGSLLNDSGIAVQGNFLPVGNALSTNGVLMPSMTASSATLREFAFASGITSSQPLGTNAGQNNDKVAIFGGTVGNHSGSTNDANIWGGNLLVTAAAGYTGTAQGLEIDVNGLSAEAISNKALALTGNFLVAPQIANAAECGIASSSLFPWSYCFWSFDGAALNFAHIGTLSTGNNTGSQPIVAASRDSGGVNRTSTIATDAGGDWVINPAVSLIVTPPGTNNLSVRGATYQLDLRGTPVTLATGSYMASHLVANPATIEPLEINATQVLFDGAVITMPSLPNSGGVITGSLCVTAGNAFYVKTTPGACL